MATGAFYFPAVLFGCLLTSILFIQLKEIFYIVDSLKAQSGFKWDDERGADIDAASESVWKDYIELRSPFIFVLSLLMTHQKHPKASTFRNKGWPHYYSVQSLVPTLAKGSHVFHPGDGEAPDGSNIEGEGDGDGGGNGEREGSEDQAPFNGTIPVCHCAHSRSQHNLIIAIYRLQRHHT